MLTAAVIPLYCLLLYCIIVENIVAITTPSYITPQLNNTFNTNSSGGFTNGSGGPGFPGGPGGPGFPGGPVGPGGGKMLRYLICLGFTTGGPPSGNGSTGIGGSTNGSNRLLTTPNHTPLIVTTLYNLCKICNISKKECTCKKEPFLCSLIKAKPGGGNGTNKTELRCTTNINNVKAAVNTITGVIGVIGNALVVAVTLKYLRTSSRCHLLIGLLAAMDLIFSIAQFIQTLPLFWTCKWVYGLAMCKIFDALANLSSVFSLGIILIIALERYKGIVNLLHGGLNTASIWILLLLNLVFGVVICIPGLIYLKMTEFGVCEEKWPGQGSLYYSWVLFIFYYILPIAIISFLYIRIILTLYSGNVMSAINEKQRQGICLTSVVVSFTLYIVFYFFGTLPTVLYMYYICLHIIVLLFIYIYIKMTKY